MKLYYEYCKSYKLNQNNCDGFIDVVDDLYFSEEVQSLRQYEQHLDIDRLSHITSVSYLSYVIAKNVGADYVKAARSAVLHDLFYYDWRDGETGKWHRLHGYKHPKYAALNASELNESISEEELKVIRRHMWPLTLLPPSSRIGMIVCFADKYCATIEVLYSVNKKYKNRILKDIEGIEV